MMKKFIITLDTEGDNLWKWKAGSPIKTENSLFIPRFQELCEQYNFIPTYLCNWEMVNDERFVLFAKDKMIKKKCEIGMHLHAWNTPPYYDLLSDETSGKPYLIEYPDDIIEKKIVCMTDLIYEKFGIRPVVHRAGRWAMDDRYFILLRKHGYIADCSVTPYVNWKECRGKTPGIGGSDYSHEKKVVSIRQGIVEVPVSTMLSYKLFNPKYRDQLSREQRKRVWWLRPGKNNLKQMLYLIRCRRRSKINYLEFMIHTSELMPGGSPTFRTNEDIEELYYKLKIIFNEISKDYEGCGLEQFVRNL